MKERILALISICIILSCIISTTIVSQKYKAQINKLSVNNLNQIVDVMYVETCQCGYDKAEVDYSIVSNNGYFYCPNCDCHYQFSLGENNNNKIIVNEAKDD